MKKRFSPSLLILISFSVVLTLPFSASGQNGGKRIELMGSLVDSAGAPLPNAAIRLTATTDSSDVHLGFSDTEGVFRIRGLRRQPYRMEIDLLGYAPQLRRIEPARDSRQIDLGVLVLHPEPEQLEGVTVSERRLPLRIRKDTLEFDVGAFETRPHAEVEELLKKLPGVEVEEDGTIRAQGEEVEKITVDGEEFFGNDPRIASRNLPADAVDKVQLYDRQSDQSMFTGIDDGEREKTINLELKPAYRKTTFGKITAGGGTEERFAGNGALNRFDQGQQLSILAMGNNTNQQGFSIGDYIQFTSGPQERRGGPGIRIVTQGRGPASGGSASAGQTGPQLNRGQQTNGLMTNWAGGVNFRDNFNDKWKISGNYFANYLDHETDQSLERINYLPEGNYRFLQEGLQQNDHMGHRGNVILDYQPDSSNSFRLNSSLGYQQTHTSSSNESRTFTTASALANSSRQTQVSGGSSLDLTADLLYRHRFGKPGRTFSATLELGLDKGDREGSLDALSQFSADSLNAVALLQENQQRIAGHLIGAGISYSEPLGARSLLELNYQVRQRQRTSQRDVWDLSGEMDDPDAHYNELLSSNYENLYQYQRGGLNFQLTGDSYRFTAGMSYQQSRLSGELLHRDTSITRDFQRFLPSLQFRYDFRGNRHLEFEYRAHLQEPSIEQLQPVVDNSDPLNLYQGNPALRPAFMQQARGQFMTFDPQSMIHLFAVLELNYTTDAISWSEAVDEQLIRTIQPVNVPEETELRANLNVGFPLSAVNGRLGISAGRGLTRGLTLLNGMKNPTRRQDLRTELRYDQRLGDFLNLSLSGRVSREHNRFNQGQDQLYVDQRYQTSATFSFLRHYGLQLDFAYSIYDSDPGDFNQEIPLLGLAVSRYLFGNNRGELRLSVDNLLDKDLGVSQRSGSNYLERSVTNSLGRYALLSFTYSINKQPDPGPRRLAPMIRMERNQTK